MKAPGSLKSKTPCKLQGWARKETPMDVDEVDYRFVCVNELFQEIIRTMSLIIRTMPLQDFMYSQYFKYVAHVYRDENTGNTKTVCQAVL